MTPIFTKTTPGRKRSHRTRMEAAQTGHNQREPLEAEQTRTSQPQRWKQDRATNQPQRWKQHSHQKGRPERQMMELPLQFTRVRPVYNCRTTEDFLKAVQPMARQTLQDIETALQSGDEYRAAELILVGMPDSLWEWDWHNAQDGHGVPTSRDALLAYYRRFTDKKLLFTTIIQLYVSRGYGYPRELIQTAASLADGVQWPERLDGLPDGNTLEVFRGTDAASNPATAYSWTLDRAEAAFFGYHHARHTGGQPAIYRGTIQRQDIICYCDTRGEQEIIQLDHVRDIVRLPMTPAELDQLLTERDARIAAEAAERTYYDDWEEFYEPEPEPDF